MSYTVAPAPDPSLTFARNTFTGQASVINRKAWAMYVDPVTLATHLKAEVQIKLTVDILRKCLSSGLASIPELIDMVASYFIADLVAKRNQDLEQAKKAQECWRSQCSPIDHFSTHQKRALKKLLKKEDPTLGHYDYDYEVMEWLYDLPHDHKLHCGDPTFNWHDVHDARRQSYAALVGTPGSGHYGVFTTHRNFLFENFKLEVWLQFDPYGSECSYRAEAYLTLPSETPDRTGRVMARFRVCPENAGDDRCGLHDVGSRCDVEEIVDCVVPTPGALEAAKCDVFARAMKKMGLETERECIRKGADVEEKLREGWMEQGNDFLWRPQVPQYREMMHVYR